MSIDSCFDEDINEAVMILESTFREVKKYSRQPTSAPYHDAKTFVTHYNLSVNMGHPTKEFPGLLEKYLQKFGGHGRGYGKYLRSAGVIVAAGSAAYAAWPEMPAVAFGCAVAAAFGVVSLACDISSTSRSKIVRAELPHEPVILDSALKKIREQRLIEAKMYAG